MIEVVVVMTAEQEIARGDASRADLLDDAESSFVFVAVRAAEFNFRFFNFFFKTPVSKLQACKAVLTSSSYFLHLPKAFVQFFKALANFFALEDKSQVLTVLAVLAMVASAQQVQAADPVFLRHSPVLLLNVEIAVLQVFTSVILGRGRLEGSQLFLISSSHLSRVSVRLVSWAAPSFFLPLHVRLDELPPPFSLILRITGPKRPFFPDLLPPVLFCFVIRASCFSKLATLSFSIFR